jgi:hypothetical protein
MAALKIMNSLVPIYTFPSETPESHGSCTKQIFTSALDAKIHSAQLFKPHEKECVNWD